MLFKKIADKFNIHWQVLLTLKSWSNVQIYSFVIESQKTIFAENWHRKLMLYDMSYRKSSFK